MDSRVKKLKSVDDCSKFCANAMRLGRADLADEARRRAVEIRADVHGADSNVEKECLKAVYAYEEVLSRKNGRRTRASRTWQMIERHGVLEAVARAVNRDKETLGYTALAEVGLQEFAFEAVILRFPDAFAPEVVSRAKERLAEWLEAAN